jgi:BolA family transcriptional regulator, general stress-responsive regulator
MESAQIDGLADDLRRKLAATHVEIADDSAAHVGHAGASAGGHYAVLVVSPTFEGRDLLARHRAVYAAVGDLAARRIHALTLRLYTPEEWRASSHTG